MDTLLSRIECREGDITHLTIEAIVNAANPSLLGGGGVDGAIHRAAGPDLLAECKTLGGCPTGHARLTLGYQLNAAHVIHTVGPVYTGSSKDPELLAACYKNSLKLALENNIKRLAFPAISCGVYRYPVKEAARIAIDTCLDFLDKNDAIKQVIFVLFSHDFTKIYQDILDNKKQALA